ETLPPALVDEARALDFPVFCVPYAMPFIAITERAFLSLVNEQFDVLQRAVSIQRWMERLVLDERSLGEVVRGLVPPRRAASSRRSPSGPGARSRCRCRAARTAPRPRGWSRCRRATASRTSSASWHTTR